jgi:hypothetical protein
MIAAGDRVFANGNQLGGAFDGSGDIKFGDDAYQVFAARGTVNKKWDGNTFNNWSIDPPSIPATLAAVNAITDTVASCDTAESPAFVTNEGTSGFVANYAGTASSAMNLIPDSGTGRASVSKKFTSDQDYLDIGGSVGGDNDLFDLRMWFQNWRVVDKATIMFGLGTGTDPYLDDYYYFDFNIRKKEEVNVKDPASSAAAAIRIASSKALNVLSPQDVTNVRSAAKASEVLKRIGRFAGPRSRERADAQEASPAWGHLSVTRGQFTRVGGTAGRNWSTVRSFKVVYTVTPGQSAQMYIDDAIWTGGGARSLTGVFTVGYRFARKFSLSDDTEVYYELSPMSPISAEVTLNQQTLQVTISSAALAAKDPQVGEVWVYLAGGWLDTYYRFATLSATPQTGMTIDELASPAGSDFNLPEERARLTSWGFTAVEGAGAGATDVVFTGNVGELEILIDNEPYIPGTTKIPDNVIATAGPQDGRMFVLDKDGYLWPTSGESPSSVSAYHTIDLRKYGTPLWLVKTSGGITAGFTKDIIRISGSGDESDDRVILDLWGDPLNVGNPPVDSSVMTDGNLIVYRSADGFMALSGSTLTPVPFAGTSLLWRGVDRHGISALNLATGRFRLEVDNHIMYALMTEGTEVDPTSIWKYDFGRQQWMRGTYSWTPLSMHREPDGSLLVGTADGKMIEIEIGDQDDNVDIPVTILTPIDDNGDPQGRKDPVDLQMHVNTRGNVGNIEFLMDHALTAEASIPFSSLDVQVFRADLTEVLSRFLRIQLRITGSFSEFVLRAFGMNYRSIPPQVMSLDLGYVLPADGGDMAWLTEAEVDCWSPVNLNMLIYKDDVYWTTQPVVVVPNKRSAWRVVMPKGTKAKRLRLVLRSTNPNGDNNQGFEPYAVRVRYHGSGNMTSLYVTGGDNA